MVIEILFWDGNEVSGDWDEVRFDSRAEAEQAGWVIDEVVDQEAGRFKGHRHGEEKKYELKA
jgi:hypothetical protein